jgi:hypothetical protein
MTATNLRERAESLLGLTVEGPFGLPVELTDPDGNIQTLSENDGETLKGQALGHRTTINPDTGVELVLVNPILVLRRSSLTRIPEDGEYWHIRMPLDPSETATKHDFMLDPSKSIEGGRSLGEIRLYLKNAVQSS